MTAPAQADRQRFDGCTLEAHLLNWARWMRLKQLPKGYPNSGSGGAEGYTTLDHDGDATYAALDEHLSHHVDAAVMALQPALRCAIYYEYELTSVWRFPRDNYAQLLVTAKENVKIMLIRRGVVVTNAVANALHGANT